MLLAALPLHAAEPPRLADLAWLAGTWAGEAGGARMEEVWTAPGGGMMLGLHRDVRPDGSAFFEFLRIEEGPEGIAYLASSMGKSPATPFPLKSLEGRRAVFENPAHDFPQRILYWLDDAEVLHARIEGVEDGQARDSEWRYKRMRP